MDRSEGSQIGYRPLLSYGYFPNGLASEISFFFFGFFLMSAIFWF